MWAFLFFAGLLSGWWGAQSSVAPPAPRLVPQKTSASEGSSMTMTMAARHDGERQGPRTVPFAPAIAGRYERSPEYYGHPASPESRPATRSHLEPYRNSLGRVEDDASSRRTSRARSTAVDSDHLESVRNLYRTYRADDEDDDEDEATDESDATSRFRHDSLPRLRYVGGDFRRPSEDVAPRVAEPGINEGSSGPVLSTLVYYAPRSQQAREDSASSGARTEKDESSPLEPRRFRETIDDYRDNVELDNFMNYQVTPSSSREQPSEESAAREAINFASDRDRIATNDRIAMENLRDYRRRHQHSAWSNDEYEAADSDEDTPRDDVASNPVTGIAALALFPTVDESALASDPRHATTDALGATSPFSMESSMERPRVSRAAVNQNAKNRNRTKQNSRREQRRQGRNNNNNNNNKVRRGQNWCPEADVGNRAYRAPTVFEGKARSMSSVRKPGSNYAVTFEVKQVYKSQPGFQPLLKNDSVRLHFRDKVPGKSTLCASNSEATGQDSSGTVRANIKRGKVYLVFVDRVGPRNFTILYEPMIRSKKNAQAVQAVIRPDYVRAVTLSELRDAVAGLQDRVKLVCRTRGSPPPRVHWFKDGKPLHPRRGLRIQHKRRRSKVVIASARVEDSGEYKCVAESFSGNRAALAAELLVTHAPETTTATWPRQEAPCPIKDDFCMNGGTCLFFETVGEPACRCAEGFTGLRCETKDVISTGSVYNRHRAPFSCKLGLSTSYYC